MIKTPAPPPLPMDNQPRKISALQTIGADQGERLGTVEQLLRNYRPTMLAAYNLSGKLQLWDTLCRNNGTFRLMAQTTPFQVITQQTGSSSWQASVGYFSDLWKSPKPTDIQTITGLASGPTTPNWFTLLPTDHIWLEISISGGGVTGATIASLGLSSSPTWTPSSDPGTSDGWYIYTTTTDAEGNTVYAQTYARILIAAFQPNTDGSPNMTQLLNSHLLMKNVVDVNTGIPILYPDMWMRSFSDLNPTS